MKVNKQSLYILETHEAFSVKTSNNLYGGEKSAEVEIV